MIRRNPQCQLELQQLKPLGYSSLYQRRMYEGSNLGEKLRCKRCGVSFDDGEQHIQVEGSRWHQHCFRCAQCFCSLESETFFKDGNRFFCEHDFLVNLAPICFSCHEFVIGNVVRSVGRSYHANCFVCEECKGSLEEGCSIIDARNLCYACKENMPKEPRFICKKCHQSIEPFELLRVDLDHFHAYHFDCNCCNITLDAKARVLKKELFCCRCYDLRCDICPDCKRPIDKEVERSVYALKRHWHVDHFKCAHCGRAFLGSKHYERSGKAYCEADYVRLFRDYCFICGAGQHGETIEIFGKLWCPECYTCIACNRRLRFKDKVLEQDMRPMCKDCYSTKKFKKVMEQKLKERK